ncbi:hypothetical protein N7462_010129 [Penicillium macrosclerotiorum]|uniref:uncharacterized protein n=1 Tax=Penicillium macrosclerotiorum TaxID=303699 RepID=UPI002548E0F9|nr:uncharacterized protein N7462_010129 [Penicillium macrosclerotiorum]KAJ5669059.1 hypothetical protein N7462_010129 [Penicillium macrosclerotiorum]
MKVDNSTQKSETHISYTDYDSNSEARLAKRETFLWVNAQDETDPNYTTEGVKQSFIRKRSNRLRRENQLQTLKASVKPFPKGRLLPGPNMSSTLDREEQQADKKDRKALVCHNMQAVWFFQEALNQPALVETLLFLSAASHTATLKMIDTSPYSIQRSMQDTLQLRSRALKSLQSNLVNPIMAFSEATILVITHLLCIEVREAHFQAPGALLIFSKKCAQANIEAVEAHMAGLQQIINALGGLERLDIRTLSTIYW